jgi:hypothetical protein
VRPGRATSSVIWAMSASIPSKATMPRMRFVNRICTMPVEVEPRLIQHVRLDLARRTSSNVGFVPTEIAAG